MAKARRRITANGYAPYNHRLTLRYPATPNGPLSLRERAGVRVLLTPATYLPGKHTRRMG
ncbi:hypothetical protein Pssp01_31930 [Pseudomonas sp. NBRC 100443]|nr:hypothetical protein Pssp01_31930 [Pseudomonas sp. NBRC 100443]